MRASTSRRGFTLVELLVGIAVASVVLLGISFAFISQARQYQAHASRRAIQSSARQAMGFMERTIRRAGYGVDPDRAIIAYDSFDPGTNAQAAGFPDAITIHSRDPSFRRIVNAAGAAQLAIDAPLVEPLPRGQILLVLCPGARTYAYVTVDTPAKTGDSSINLDPAVPAVDSPMGKPGTLFHQQASLGGACFQGAEKPSLVKIDRASFYLASFDEDGDNTTPNRVPFLMMHRGLDISGGPGGIPDGIIDANDAVPVAEGIEQMQFGYILNVLHGNDPVMEKKVPPIVGMDNAVLPLNGGTHVWSYGEAWPIDFAADAPKYQDPYDAPSRTTAHPANIRQVRVTLVSRSSAPDAQFAGDDALNPGEAWASGNYDGAPTWAQLENLGNTPNVNFDPRGGGFYRVVLRQAIVPKNMLSRSQFLPITNGGG